MTPDKKRLLWILIAILFFFANLILATVMLLNAGSEKTAPATPAATAPATQQ